MISPISRIKPQRQKTSNDIEWEISGHKCDHRLPPASEGHGLSRDLSISG